MSTQSSSTASPPRMSSQSGTIPELAMPALLRKIEGKHHGRTPLVGSSNLSQVWGGGSAQPGPDGQLTNMP